MSRLSTAALLAILIAVPALAVSPRQKTEFRGFTCVPQMTKADLVDIKNRWGANIIRVMIWPANWQGKYPSMEAHFQMLLENVRRLLPEAGQLGIAVVLDLHQIPNDHPAKSIPGNPYDKTKEANKYSSWQYWHDPSNLEVMKQSWAQIAKMTAQYPKQTIWLELLNEPLDWDSFPSYPKQLPMWYEQTIAVIRQYDRFHPVAVSPGPGSLSWGFKDFPLIKDPDNNVIYVFHMWQPIGYTLQGVNQMSPQPWPGVSPSDDNVLWNKAKLLEDLRWAIAFQDKYHVRMYVSELGVPRFAPGRDAFLRDELNIIESHGWDWTYHAYRESPIWSPEASTEAALIRRTSSNGKTVEKKITVDSIESIMHHPDNVSYVYQPYGSYEARKTNIVNDLGKILQKYMARNKK